MLMALRHWTGSQLLRRLIQDFLSEKLPTDVFCSDFITAYNAAVDERVLTAGEQPPLERLLSEVSFYSPFPEERARIPNYRSEMQVREAAVAAEAALSQMS